jgi:hypothetical protein
VRTIRARDQPPRLVPVLRGIVAADVHNLIFQADWRIVPAVLR